MYCFSISASHVRCGTYLYQEMFFVVYLTSKSVAVHLALPPQLGPKPQCGPLDSLHLCPTWGPAWPSPTAGQYCPLVHRPQEGASRPCCRVGWGGGGSRSGPGGGGRAPTWQLPRVPHTPWASSPSSPAQSVHLLSSGPGHRRSPVSPQCTWSRAQPTGPGGCL